MKKIMVPPLILMLACTLVLVGCTRNRCNSETRELIIQIVQQGSVFTGGYNAWPSIAKMDNGKVAAVWSGGREDHVSADGNIYFSTACQNDLVFDPPTIIPHYNTGVRDAGIAFMGNGRIIVTSFFNVDLDLQFYGHGSFYHLSDDYGKTWTPAREFPVMSLHGPIFHDGVLYYLGTVPLYNADGSENSDGGENQLFTSNDFGESWTKGGTVPLLGWMNPLDFIEPNLAILPNGEMIAALRFLNFNNQSGYYNNTFFYSISQDMGETWSLPIYSGINGTPPSLLVHSSGFLICSYTRRNDPHSIRTIISENNGETWSNEFILNDNQQSWDIGYPHSIELDNGNILTVFYGDSETSQLGEKSILFVEWEIMVLISIC